MNILYGFLKMVAGIAVLYAILVFLPMLFTYLSSGGFRP